MVFYIQVPHLISIRKEAVMTKESFKNIHDQNSLSSICFVILTKTNCVNLISISELCGMTFFFSFVFISRKLWRWFFFMNSPANECCQKPHVTRHSSHSEWLKSFSGIHLKGEVTLTRLSISILRSPRENKLVCVSCYWVSFCMPHIEFFNKVFFFDST